MDRRKQAIARRRGAIRGAVTARILFSGSTLDENTATGTLIGALSVVGVTGTPSYTLVDSDGSRVALSSANINVGATTPDYETHPIITFTVSVSGTTPAISNTSFQVFVNDLTESGGSAGEPMGLLLTLTKAA